MLLTTITTDPETITEDISEVKSVLSGIDLYKVLSTVILAVICIVAVKVLLHLLDRFLKKGKVEKTLHAFIRTGVRILLIFLAVLIIASQLGFNVTSLVALLSVAGLAISLAVQSSLANLAGGIQILASKPFKVGDYIDAAGINGTVLEINMIHTKLRTPDSKVIFVPNSDLAAAKLTNFSAEENRRVDIVCSASYDDAPEKVLAVLRELVSAHPKALADPEPFVRLSGYKDSCIEYTVRVWAKNEDYWDLYFDLLEQIKPRFDAAGIEMTYPHLNVHMIPDKSEENK